MLVLSPFVAPAPAVDDPWSSSELPFPTYALRWLFFAVFFLVGQW